MTHYAPHLGSSALKMTRSCSQAYSVKSGDYFFVAERKEKKRQRRWAVLCREALSHGDCFGDCLDVSCSIWPSPNTCCTFLTILLIRAAQLNSVEIRTLTVFTDATLQVLATPSRVTSALMLLDTIAQVLKCQVDTIQACSCDQQSGQKLQVRSIPTEQQLRELARMVAVAVKAGFVLLLIVNRQ